MISSINDVETAVQAMKHGAYHYVTKDVDHEQLRSLVHNASERQDLNRQVLTLSAQVEQRNQDETRRRLNAAVDALIQQNKLVAPEGDNAFERLQEVLQVAPGYPEAQRRLDEITTALRTRAEEALQAKRFDVAETRIAEALAVAPQDAAVLAVQKRIQTARLGAERDKRITELLAGATAARKAGKLFGDDGDNALALLRQARDIDPEHAATKAALAELAGEILKPVSASLQAGKFDEAERLLDASESFLASEPAWQALQKELEQGRNRVAQQQRIDSLLAEAQRRLTAGRIAEPAGDNALESLARIAEIDRLLSAQLNEIMHSEDFQKLEGSWRGLNQLVMNSETSPQLKIRVMSVNKKNFFQN